MIFTYKVLNHDTFEIFAPDGSLFLLFTCDKYQAEADERCWMCVLREAGNNNSALNFLQQAWPGMGWPVGAAPELIECLST